MFHKKDLDLSLKRKIFKIITLLTHAIINNVQNCINKTYFSFILKGVVSNISLSGINTPIFFLNDTYRPIEIFDRDFGCVMSK